MANSETHLNPLAHWSRCNVLLLCAWLGAASAAHPDSVPDPFLLTQREAVAPGSIQLSDAITVAGIDEAATISISAAYYSINGRSYTNSAGQVVVGDTVLVRTTASPLFSTTLTATLTIGGQSAMFSVRTADAPTEVPTPSSFKLDKFYLPEIDGLQPSTSFKLRPGIETRSGAVAVKGLGTATAPISIIGGSYSVNGAASTSAQGVVKNGAAVLVTASTPSGVNDASSATLYIGARAASLNSFTHFDPFESTPTTLPGTQAYVLRDWGPVPQRAFVYRPSGWKPHNRRTALVFFFGGGWTTGEPSKSVSWAKWAATKGMVGIAPDYRTNERFGTTPLSAVDDARAALRWVQEQANTLGIDPDKVVVGGNSAGGHLALWTAIPPSPPGSDSASAPRSQPAAIVLISAVSDTSVATGYTPTRFGVHADALNPHTQLAPQMPPTIAFHGDADTTVPVTHSSRLCELMQAAGNVCQFVNVEGGTHSYRTQTDLPLDWKVTTNTMIEQFLREQGLLP